MGSEGVIPVLLCSPGMTLTNVTRS
jgi:hypothetical protein